MTDAELVKRARDGDDAAFGELLARYESTMRAIIRRKLESNSYHDDVWQDACWLAYQNLTSLRDDSSFKSWLSTIVENKAASQQRSDSSAAKVIERTVLRVSQDDEAEGSEDEGIDTFDGALGNFGDYSDEPALLAEAYETLEKIERNAPADECWPVPIDNPDKAALWFLAALAWPETDAKGHKHRDDSMVAIANLCDRQGRALGYKSPNRLTMTVQQQENAIHLMVDRLNKRLAAASVAMFVLAGFKRPDFTPWTVPAAANSQVSQSSWRKAVWKPTLPVLHLAWKLRGVCVRRGYGTLDTDALLDLSLDTGWVADALTGAERLAPVLHRIAIRGEQTPFLEIPAQVRLLPQ